jgi:hypothetical protein
MNVIFTGALTSAWSFLPNDEREVTKFELSCAFRLFVGAPNLSLLMILLGIFNTGNRYPVLTKINLLGQDYPGFREYQSVFPAVSRCNEKSG